MRGPYEVLGVSPDASDDDVKAAYRALAKKYRASEYKTSPLSDIAQRRLQEADRAYNEIIERRADSHLEELFDIRYDAADAGRGAYSMIRTALYSGELDTAEKLLAAEQNQGAEWHFLMGRFNYKKGWLDQARQHFEKAVELEPNNREYQRAMLHMEEGGTLSEHDKGKRRDECCDCCDCGCGCDCDCCDCCGCDCG